MDECCSQISDMSSIWFCGRHSLPYLDNVAPSHGIFVLELVSHIFKEVGHGASLDMVVRWHGSVQEPPSSHDAAVYVIDFVVLDSVFAVDVGFESGHFCGCYLQGGGRCV